MALEQFQKYFGLVDFIVLIGLLTGSALIGGYFAYKDRKEKSTDTYLFGGRNMSPIPVAMSMAVSFVSAITVIGYPVETYLYGLVILWMIPAGMVAATISALYYIPLIFRLNLHTIYQYLEMRFNKTARKLISGVVLIEFTIYMGITVYLPALGLNAVTPLSLNWTIAITSIVCTFYTVLGGMKAVIWTDMLQGIIMIFGSLALFVKTLMAIGGFDNLISATRRGERNNFFYFDPDPRIRSTSFSLFIGMCLISIVGSCCTQIYCQRYMSCRSPKDAKIATFLRVVPVSLFGLLAGANGLAMYAYYEGCDPTKANIIDKVDQTVPRLVIEVFEDVPGMAGLFVSAALSGTMSTVSSGVNAMAAMTTEDFIKPHWKTISDRNLTSISKLVSLIFGATVMSVAYAVSVIETTIIQVSMTFIGIVNGPVLSVFTSGIFVPWSNSKGAITGTVGGWCVAGWVACSSVLHEIPEEFRRTLPLSTESCNFSSYHTLPEANISRSYESEGSFMSDFTPAVDVLGADNEGDVLARTLYAISPYFLGFFGFLVAFVLTCLTSVITGRTNPGELDPKLFLPLVDNKILPKPVRTFFRFGVRDLDMEEKKDLELNDFALQKKNECGADSNNVPDKIADISSLLPSPQELNVYIESV